MANIWQQRTMIYKLANWLYQGRHMQTLATTRKHHTPVCTIRTTNFMEQLHSLRSLIHQLRPRLKCSHSYTIALWRSTVQGKFGMPSFLEAGNYLVPKYMLEYIIFMKHKNIVSMLSLNQMEGPWLITEETTSALSIPKRHWRSR